MSTPAKPEPTPYIDRGLRYHDSEGGLYESDEGRYVGIETARTLERHLRRIVECRDNLIKPDEMGTFGELMNAIRDAKETLSK